MNFSLVLFVCFIMVMFLWLLSMLAVIPVSTGWLAFFACLILGITVINAHYVKT